MREFVTHTFDEAPDHRRKGSVLQRNQSNRAFLARQIHGQNLDRAMTGEPLDGKILERHDVRAVGDQLNP